MRKQVEESTAAESARWAVAAQCARVGPRCRRGGRRLYAPSHNSLYALLTGVPSPACILNDRLLTWRAACPPDILPTATPAEGEQGRRVPAKPRWLLAIPDAITQLEALDPRPPHPPRPRAALRRLEGARHAADDDLRRRPDRAPADPAARHAPAPASPAPDRGRLPRRGDPPRAGRDRDPAGPAHQDPGGRARRGA